MKKLFFALLCLVALTTSCKKDNAFTQVSNQVVNGNTKIEVPASADITTQKNVLIWCKAFSVLFGSAELK